MRDKEMAGRGGYEPFYVMLNEYRIADLVITAHARSRYEDRSQGDGVTGKEAAFWLWQCLKQKRVKPHSPGEPEMYVVDNDLVMAARIVEMPGEADLYGNPLYKLIVVSFLGKMSENIDLRDLKSYFARQRSSRRVSLMQSGRKRR
ncbi:hypothetical protein G5B47_12960 [Paenibacillus sp. 7124]|uniref:Periplasmic protein n=1 Tax=Paenibacillus apii TaxID=1850370 RepID=A0A6M1PJE6_9BACL|nr:hypothetical protein [Paenibacillus apii]NGM83326.1 hypothetical protein [Paenibacillus apii]NJJ38975.1 hypothetical protein [Paenibacillus apii]